MLCGRNDRPAAQKKKRQRAKNYAAYGRWAEEAPWGQERRRGGARNSRSESRTQTCSVEDTMSLGNTTE